MKCSLSLAMCLAAVAFLFCPATRAEQHRATRLGNPATRFAPPLAAPDDLRARFRDPRLKPDFASVLNQWGWRGNIADLFKAAESAEIEDVKINVGTTMPFMSSRENGKAICLRNVLWAGKEAAPAYAFNFTSLGRRYRCVTPKACSNFFVEDLGPVPVASLALQCIAPAEVLSGRSVRVCLNVRNPGSASEPRATVRLAIPQGLNVTRATEGGTVSGSEVSWEISSLDPGSARELCVELTASGPGIFAFEARASGLASKPVQTSCATKVIGIPAILIDAVDLEDPVEVGKEVTYVIKVTNQGSAPGTHIQLACSLPAGEEYVSGGGATAMQLQNGLLVTDPLETLAPKAAAVWRVVVKATAAGDVRFRIDLTSDQFQRPILEEESTHLY